MHRAEVFNGTFQCCFPTLASNDHNDPHVDLTVCKPMFLQPADEQEPALMSVDVHLSGCELRQAGAAVLFCFPDASIGGERCALCSLVNPWPNVCHHTWISFACNRELCVCTARDRQDHLKFII